MPRISVIGSSGSGKTTVARELARKLDEPHIELDSIFHQSGWVPLPDTEFRARVAGLVEGDGWVIDGNYGQTGVADIIWERADTIIWLDLSRRTVMRRVVARTLRRAITRQELWNGNREPLTNFYSLDPQKNIVVWTWTRHRPRRHEYERLLRSGRWSHCDVVRLGDPAAVESYLSEL